MPAVREIANLMSKAEMKGQDVSAKGQGSHSSLQKATPNSTNNVFKNLRKSFKAAQKSGDSKLLNTYTDLVSKNGVFGKEYTLFEGGKEPYAAIDYLSKRKKGNAVKSIPTSADGNVDLPYGNGDYYVNSRTGKPGGGRGLSHISHDDGRTIQDAYNMVDTFKNGTPEPGFKEGRTTYTNQDGTRQAAINRDNFGEAIEPYVMTAYDVDKTKNTSVAESKLNVDATDVNSSVAQNEGNVNGNVFLHYLCM